MSTAIATTVTAAMLFGFVVVAALASLLATHLFTLSAIAVPLGVVAVHHRRTQHRSARLAVAPQCNWRADPDPAMAFGVDCRAAAATPASAPVAGRR